MNRKQKTLFTCLAVWSAYSIASTIGYLIYTKKQKSKTVPAPVDISAATRDYHLNVAAIRRATPIVERRLAQGDYDGWSLEDIKKAYQQEIDFQKIAVREDV